MFGPRAGKISRFAKDGSTTCGPRAGRQAELYPAAGNAIDQLDGNSSLRSESEMNYPDVHPNSNLAKNSEAYNIKVQIGNRPKNQNNPSPRNCSRKTILRDEGLVQALNLPVVSLYNMRSSWSKINNLADDINMRGTDLCFLTEIWEKQESKKHQRAIEEMMEMKGVKYISTPRVGGRRGGGVAIAYSPEKFQVSKLNIDVPRPLECILALVKPTGLVGKAKRIIAICFYSPPRSKSNGKLLDFLSEQISRLRREHNDCGIIVCGDRNNLVIARLLSIDPALKQIVNKNTNKNQDKILDVICTDLSAGYQEPTILPAIKVDDGKEGVPSDHLGVEARPRTNLSKSKAAPPKQSFFVRRMPDSLISSFGCKLAGQDWDGFLKAGMTSTEMANAFEARADQITNDHFPLKKVTVTQGELPYFNEELKIMRRQRDRVYVKEGKSAKYQELQRKFQIKLRCEATKYKDKIIQEVADGKRGSSYNAIRKLGDGPCDADKRKEFTIPSYVDNGLTPDQAANKLADHFSAISQTVPPLDVEKFHPALRLEIEKGRSQQRKPSLSQHDTYRKLLKIKKPNSSVPGDVPKRLIAEYPFLWAEPATKIFNNIIQSAEWPKHWKLEHMIALHKTEDPRMVKDENDVRSISKTSFLSKTFENILGDWLLPIVDPYLDPSQCGGLKNTSVNHYLVKLLNFIHTAVDQPTPTAVVMAALDLSKAYNRGDSMVVEDLYDMHVPGWLLAIICSYLSNRKMVLKYQQATSSERNLPGGYGAGTWLGGFLFIIKFNGICLRPPIPRPVSGNKGIQLKYIDDATKAATVNLRKSLIPDTQNRSFPLNFHERTQMAIKHEENVLQHELDRFAEETARNNLVLNEKKTVIMLFNFARELAFPPEFFVGGKMLEVKSEMKILGCMIQNNLKWDAHINYVIKKASKSIWRLRRMKQLGVDNATLATFWKSEGRVHLEANCPVWAGAITQRQSRALTRVQRKAVATITEKEYSRGRVELNLEVLPDRRLKLAQKFAEKTVKKSRHKDTFEKLPNPPNTRRGKNIWKEPISRTTRHKKSPVPFLTRLLNNKH